MVSGGHASLFPSALVEFWWHFILNMSHPFMQTFVWLSPSYMNDFSLRDQNILSTTLSEHHVQKLITLKLDGIKIFV